MWLEIRMATVDGNITHELKVGHTDPPECQCNTLLMFCHVNKNPKRIKYDYGF